MSLSATALQFLSFSEYANISDFEYLKRIGYLISSHVEKQLN